MVSLITCKKALGKLRKHHIDFFSSIFCTKNIPSTERENIKNIFQLMLTKLLESAATVSFLYPLILFFTFSKLSSDEQFHYALSANGQKMNRWNRACGQKLVEKGRTERKGRKKITLVVRKDEHPFKSRSQIGKRFTFFKNPILVYHKRMNKISILFGHTKCETHSCNRKRK